MRIWDWTNVLECLHTLVALQNEQHEAVETKILDGGSKRGTGGASGKKKRKLSIGDSFSLSSGPPQSSSSSTSPSPSSSSSHTPRCVAEYVAPQRRGTRGSLSPRVEFNEVWANQEASLVYCACGDGNIYGWDPVKQSTLQTLSGHQDVVYRVRSPSRNRFFIFAPVAFFIVAARYRCCLFVTWVYMRVYVWLSCLSFAPYFSLVFSIAFVMTSIY